MRVIATLLLLLASCETVKPDEFHLGYTFGGFDSTGTLDHDRWRSPISGDSDGDFSAVTAGLTWHLGESASAQGQREMVREMARTNALLAESLSRPAPVSAPPADTVSVGEEPPGEQALALTADLSPPAWDRLTSLFALALDRSVEVEPNPATPGGISITVQAGSASAASEDRSPSPPGSTDTTSPGSSGHASGAPQGVELLGISSEVWTQLIVAGTTLLLALAGWLGRAHIPYVKELTAEGKSARADREAGANDPAC